MSFLNDKLLKLTILRDQKYNIASSEGMGMKWYSFNIHFRLILSIIILVSDIVNITKNYGDLCGISWNIDVYLSFAWIFDVVLVIGTILTIQWLVRFDKKGVRFYFITQYLSQVVLVVVIFLLLGINSDTLSETVGKLIAYAIFFAFEYKYWKKRMHLFDDANQRTSMHGSNINIQTEPNDFNDVPGSHTDSAIDDETGIKFCRKCGYEIDSDGEFCARCGAEIIRNVVN